MRMETVLNIYILHSLRSHISPGGPLGGGPPWLGAHCCCGEWVGPENRPSDGGPGGPRSPRGSLGPPPPNRWSGGGPLGSLGWSLGSPDGPRLSSTVTKTKWLYKKIYNVNVKGLACSSFLDKKNNKHVPHHDTMSTCTIWNQGNQIKCPHIKSVWKRKQISVWTYNLELTYLRKKNLSKFKCTMGVWKSRIELELQAQGVIKY